MIPAGCSEAGLAVLPADLNLSPSGYQTGQIFGDYLETRPSAPECAQNLAGFKKRAKKADKPLRVSGLSC